MKNLFCLTLVSCFLVASCQAEVDTRRIEDAIEQSDLSRVKTLLNKLDNKEMTPQERKKMLEDLYEIAEDVTQKRASGLTSSSGDWRDTVRKVFGALCVIGSAANFARVAITRDASKAVEGLIGAGCGVYLLAKKGDLRDTFGALFVSGAVQNFYQAAIEKSALKASSGVFGGALGGYLIYSGSALQNADVVKARAIQKFIKGKLNDLESQTE